MMDSFIINVRLTVPQNKQLITLTKAAIAGPPTRLPRQPLLVTSCSTSSLFDVLDTDRQTDRVLRRLADLFLVWRCFADNTFKWFLA